ncbi:unnamed protein product [Fasciola hepatica]|uniref:Uncharacterized protein n=1 Tax=Fasciola hepatica TaxID=6192 RepID=A0ABC9HHR7_FASHE
MDTGIIKITDASVQHNVTVFRGHLKRKSDEQMKFEVCKTEEDTRYRYRTRLKLNNCFHKSAAELQNNTRLLTYWSGCPICADFNTTKGFSNMTHSKFEQISCQMKVDGIGEAQKQPQNKEEPRNLGTAVHTNTSH